MGVYPGCGSGYIDPLKFSNVMDAYPGVGASWPGIQWYIYNIYTPVSVMLVMGADVSVTVVSVSGAVVGRGTSPTASTNLTPSLHCPPVLIEGLATSLGTPL